MFPTETTYILSYEICSTFNFIEVSPGDKSDNAQQPFKTTNHVATLPKDISVTLKYQILKNQRITK